MLIFCLKQLTNVVDTHIFGMIEVYLKNLKNEF